MGKKSNQLKTSMELTAQQRNFVDILVANWGQMKKADAAEKAGYTSTRGKPYEQASRLLNPDLNPHVVAFMNKYKAEIDEKYGVSYGRHIRDLQRIRDQALEAGAYSAAVQAEKARGLAQGNIYVNKSEIRHGSIDSMSREEVEKELEKIRDTYGTSIINVTPKEEKPKQLSKKLRKSILSDVKVKSEKSKKKVTLN